MKYILFLLVFVLSCGEPPLEEVNMCDNASTHLTECGIKHTPLSLDCNEQEAETIINTTCSDLTNPGKADFFSNILCRAGVLFLCSVDTCEGAESQSRSDWSSCEQYITEAKNSDCRTCDYYRCRNAISEHVCSKQNYYLNFGNRYCLKYAQMTEKRMSPEGVKWSQRIRTCLMNFAEKSIKTTATCGETETLAIDSHTECYTSTGFCELPVSDWIKVLSTVEPGDFELKSAILTGVDCVKSYANENPGVLEE